MPNDRQHIVRRGECMLSIAHRYGLSDWEAVWNDEANAALRRVRSNPMVLAPGDRVMLPRAAPRPLEVQTGAENRYRARVEKVQVLLTIVDDAGTALANKPYVALYAGQRSEGTTNGEGHVTLEVPAQTTEVNLRVTVDPERSRTRTFHLGVGDLDPSDAPRGVQGRLSGLGLYHGAIDGVMGEQTCAALSAFQRARGLEPTGAPDAATLSALEEAAGA